MKGQIKFERVSSPAIPVLSIDLEDYYHGNYPGFDYTMYNFPISRFIEPTVLMLDILASTGSFATFFVLGECARKYPKIIKRIANEGHEIASHGEDHRLFSSLSERNTLVKIGSSIAYLEQLIGKKVHGYRAPNFCAHSKKTIWLFEGLAEMGLLYDSSRFPSRNWFEGEPTMLKHPHLMKLPSGLSIYEIPVSSMGSRGLRIVWSGGFYWRILPLKLSIKAIENKISKGFPAVFYLHPKDIDPENPRLPVGFFSNWIHLVGTKKGLSKLKEMCEKIRFSRLIDILPSGAPEREQPQNEEMIKQKNRF